MMKRGDEITLVVESFGSEGKSVARVDGFVVFIPGGIPGDTVTARVTRVSRNFAESRILTVVTPSTLRTTPRCSYYGTCGGCSWQHLSYPGQCEFKRQQVVDALERIGGFTGATVLPTLGAENEFYYRNKMEFSFGVRWLTAEELAQRTVQGQETTPADQFALGLHIPRRFDRVLDLHACYLQSQESAAIVNAVRAFAKERELTIYSTFTHTGYLRNLVIRETRHTDERMVNIVTSEERPAVMETFRAMLLERFPSITTIVNNITDRKSQVALGDREIVLHGSGWLTERIGKRTYRISANSFFQTNTLQAEQLYDTVRAFADLKPHETVFDLYSGTGTIALHVADDAGTVIGVESVASAVEDARKNAEVNGVTNCRFVLGDLKDRLLDQGTEAELAVRPDVILCDPPRAGMHPKVIESIRALHPGRIVYVSCNPATQARDCKLLCEDGAYTLRESRPVDMFPHTTHVENVALLIARGGS